MTESRDIDERRTRRYQLENGWWVVAGRTDADNEYVSLRLAHPKDWWFHARGCPGSHVLLLHRDDLEPDRDTLRAAASVAAWHSKARKAKRVEVDVVRASDVSKSRGSPRGQVTIRRSRTVKVPPKLPDSTTPESN